MIIYHKVVAKYIEWEKINTEEADLWCNTSGYDVFFITDKRVFLISEYRDIEEVLKVSINEPGFFALTDEINKAKFARI